MRKFATVVGCALLGYLVVFIGLFLLAGLFDYLEQGGPGTGAMVFYLSWYLSLIGAVIGGIWGLRWAKRASKQ